jgi:hypothetical protein
MRQFAVDVTSSLADRYLDKLVVPCGRDDAPLACHPGVPGCAVTKGMIYPGCSTFIVLAGPDWTKPSMRTSAFLSRQVDQLSKE